MNNEFENYIRKIDFLLEKREKSYPIRDQNYQNLNMEIEKLCQFLRKLNTIDKNNLNFSYLKIQKRFLDQPIFICGAMKSGTSLILQLLDGHKNLLVLPGDSHYFNLFFKTKWDFNELYKHWMKRLTNPTGQKPFWFLGKKEEVLTNFLLDFEYFYEKFQSEPFLALISTIYVINQKNNLNIKYWVEKTPDNEYHIRDFVKKYPKAKFIHILRNPINSFTSLKRLYKFRDREFNSWIMALYIKKSYKKALKNQKKIGKDKYFILKYEDLVSDTKNNMIKICDYLDIIFEEIVSIPTENRKPATANSMYKNSRIRGLVKDQTKDNNRFNELIEKEKKEIVSILYHNAIKNGYNEWKKEDIKQYYNVFHKIKINFLKRPLNKVMSIFLNRNLK